MFAKKPSAALAAGSLMLATVAAVAQNGGPAQNAARGDAQVLVLEELARIDWVETSKVAALREGVIEKMELQIGMPVDKDGVIGTLHKEIAELTVRKNKLQADAIAPEQKARAQREVALSVVARNENLNRRKPGLVSDEDVAKAIGELKVADAQLKEAQENEGIAKAELALAERILAEHTIRAPFKGIVLERMRNPGESVRANEAVVKLGNLTKLCAETYVPLAFAYRVKEGQVVEVQPRLKLSRGEPLPIEKKRYRGKITFVHPQIQPVAETAVRVRAEFENAGDLRPGLMVQMTIFLTPDAAASATDAASPTRTAQAQ